MESQRRSYYGKPRAVSISGTIVISGVICLAAGGHDPDAGSTGLACLAKLDLCWQVYDEDNFVEFLVRNAMKYAAKEVLASSESSEDR